MEKVRLIADMHLQHFMDIGHADAGNNGPYGDNDTAMRNTAHWCCIYSYLFRRYKEQKYKDILCRMSAYLMEPRHYGVSGAAICRRGNNDDTNGVIGQAWVVEGLLAGYQVLGQNELMDKAVSIFNAQQFDENAGLWKICCSDGKMAGYDYVYNHNLWMAAAGALILCFQENFDIRKKIMVFLDKSKYTCGVQPSGCLFHLANIDFSMAGRLKFGAKMILTDMRAGKYKNMNYLEKGYQLFDLYGFALLKNQFSEHNMLKSTKLVKAVKFGLKRSSVNKLGTDGGSFNKYAYPYNSPAFEYSYVALKLGKGCDEVYAQSLLKIQFGQLYDDTCGKFSFHNNDANTLTARLYELVRYFDEKE